MLAVGEAILRAWAPVSLVTIGHRFNANASLYGWGFDARERIVIPDPDTGEVHVDYTNAAGWRDRDHARGRVPGVFRVLVLGDSVTYGAIVGLEDVYTRLLERTLLDKGYSVEVISVALGRWGTDQELEALRLEGLSYAPDLVIVQFTGNDPWDNVAPIEDGVKPFHYEVGPDGSLVRRSNPLFVALHREELKDLGWRRFRDRFEILKRWVLLDQRLEGKARPTVHPAPGQGRQIEYVVGDWGLLMLTREFGVDDGSDLARWLRERRGQVVSEQELRARLRSSSVASRSEEVLRSFENRWFQEVWKSQFEGFGLTSKSGPGRLLVALLDEMVRLTRQGASFLLFSTHEQGHFDWDRYCFTSQTVPSCTRGTWP